MALSPVYRSGDYYVVDVSRGSLGDRLAEGAIKWFTHSQFNHAFIVTSKTGDIVEATPKLGVHRSHISQYEGMPMVPSSTYLTPEQRGTIVSHANSLVGRDGYGFLDIAFLALYTQGYRWKWLESEVLEESNRTICSQLVAMCGQSAGVNEWMCGKEYPQLVTPANLGELTVMC